MAPCFGIVKSRPRSRQDGGVHRRGKIQTGVGPLKRRGGGISRGKIAAPRLVLPSSRQTQTQTRVGSCLTEVSASSKSQMSDRVLGDLAACCALHVFI